MPGEQLTCVWQAVPVFDSNKTFTSKAPKDAVRKVTSTFKLLQSVNFSEISFDKTFTDESIEFDDYKIYARKTLREKGVAFGILRDNIEDLCWDIVKPTYKSSISDNNLQKLWKISNRLIKEGTYPPKMCKEEVCWFTDKVLSSLGKNMISPDELFKNDNYLFAEFVQILDDLVFKQTTEDKLGSCIDDLYSWLVVEILKKEKVYMRCKKRANWSTWAKRCCILTPLSLNVYTGELEKVDILKSNKKIEFVLTKHTKVESLPMYKGIIHNLKGRFRISNIPFAELEIAVEDDNEKRSWLNHLEEILTCINENTTPVQKLLRSRYEKRINSSGSVKSEKLDDALERSQRSFTRTISVQPDPSIHKESSDNATDVIKKEKTTSERPAITSKPPIKASDKMNGMQTKKKEETDIIAINREKLKAVFVKIDENGNGLLDKDEFSKFIKGIGLKMVDKEINLVFKSVDTDNKGQVTFDQFETYFSKYVLDETTTAECVNAMRKAFLEADKDGSGTLNFREFTEYVWEKKRSIRMSKVMTSFSSDKKDEITFSDFQQMIQGGHSDLLTSILEETEETENPDESAVSQLESQLKQVYSNTDSGELASYIRKRWDKFATFRRQGKTGTVVMKGGHGMVADFVPGEYSLIDLTCFSDLPPLVPKYTSVRGVVWESSKIPGKSGKVLFPSDFDGKVVTEYATTELVRYYGCSFADANQEKISLLFRHGIQDFTYENGYLEKYVASANGGSGIERHDFSHLDCPLTSDPGIFILAKFTEDGEFHITGFNIPERHTLYIPGGCIHSNDYLKGTWRTMLSDETDIDHVHLTRRNELSDNQEIKFQFTFV